MSESSIFINDITSSLFHNFCLLGDNIKPKIKEIITMTAKNMIDLTKCLIELHEVIRSPKFKHLDIYSQTSYEMGAWHNEIIAAGLAQRRSISRMMTELKYMMSNIEETDELFSEMDEITRPIKQNWKPELSLKTGESLREILLDLVLIVDPDIKGKRNTINRDDLDIIQRRISEMSDKSKLYLLPRNQKMFKSQSLSSLSKKIHEEVIPEETNVETGSPMQSVSTKSPMPFLVMESTDKSYETDQESSVFLDRSASVIEPIRKKKLASSVHYNNKSQKCFLKTHKVLQAKPSNTQSQPNLIVQSHLYTNKQVIVKTNTPRGNQVSFDETSDHKMERFDLPMKIEDHQKMRRTSPTNTVTIVNQSSFVRSIHQAPGFKDNQSPNNEIHKIEESKKSFNFSHETFFEKAKIQQAVMNKNNRIILESQQPEAIFELLSQEKDRSVMQSNPSGNIVQIDFNSKDTFGKPTTNPESLDITSRKSNSKRSIDISLDNICLSKRQEPGEIVNGKQEQPFSPKIEIIDESTSRNIHGSGSQIRGESIGGNLNSYYKEMENYKNILEQINQHQQESRLNNIQVAEQARGLFKNGSMSEAEISSLATADMKNLFKPRSQETLVSLKQMAKLNLTKSPPDSSRSIVPENPQTQTGKVYVVNNGNIFDKTPRELPKDASDSKFSDYTVQSYRFSNNEASLSKESRRLTPHKISQEVIGESCSPKPKKPTEKYSLDNNSKREDYNKQLKQIPQIIDFKTPVRYSSSTVENSKDSIEKKRRMVKQSKFDMRDFLSGRDSEKIHINFDGVEKLALSNDGEYLIFGGEGLHVLDMTENNFKMIRYDKAKSK